MVYIYSYLIRIFSLSLLSVLLVFQSMAQTSQTDHADAKHAAEDLWASIDFITIKKEVIFQTKISSADIDLFAKFLMQQYPEEQPDFFKQAEKGLINNSNIAQYTTDLIKKYIQVYPLFLKQKTAFAIQQNPSTNLPLSVNGPCENVDFEDGTTNGWTGSIGTACQNPTPCAVVTGFSPTRHQIMSTTMVDPYIPSLSVVAPGGNYSFRLENYVNGGNASMVQQTFLVTPTNNIFTYQYAAVLEDPGDHGDAERPYFKVRMYDKNRNEITCANYTAIAKPPIKNFVYSKVVNPNYDPNDFGGLNGSPYLDLYYRDWTVVSIPLLAYIGQNITVEFIASDCSRGGHLGYAYIDAKCSFLDTKIPPTICGSEDVTLYGPNDFYAYQWSGTGIVGSKTTQNITVNKSGVYKVQLTPFAENPCPIIVSTTVPERCLPVPITASLCESIKGTGIANKVDLTSYNVKISTYNSLARVLEWHSAKPATTANKINSPTNINIANGSRYYAIIKYTTAGTDTAEINFTVNSLPTMQFPSINPICLNTSTYTITGVSPTGGVFKGAHVTAAGIFSPTATGTFPITYIATTNNGCIDSIKSPIVVNTPPMANVGADQKICSNNTVPIALTATANDQISTLWTGGSGAFTTSQSLATTYTPSASDISSGAITLTLTAKGKAPCANASDNIRIQFIKPPTVSAGPDQDLCMDVASSVVLSGGVTQASNNTWTGGSGIFSNTHSLTPVYQPAASELQAGNILLTLTAAGNAPCASITDKVEIRFHAMPIANAGPDQITCVGNTITVSTEVVSGINYSWLNKNETILSSIATGTIKADSDSLIMLKITDQNNCIGRDTMHIEAFKPPVFNLKGPLCFTDQLLLNANATIFSSSPELPYWKRNGIDITRANQYTLNVTEDGVYTIYYKHGDCVTSANTSVYKNPVLVTPDQFTVCEETSVTITTSSIPQSTYTWYKNNSPVSETTNSLTINAAPGKTTYYVHVTDQNDCSAMDSSHVTGIPHPLVHLKDTSICENKTTTLDGTPLNLNALGTYPVAYTWMFNNTVVNNSAASIPISKAGTYSITASIGACESHASMYLTIHPIPVIHLPNLTKFCPDTDGDILLDAGANNNYVWYPGGEKTQTIQVKNEGIYSVTVTSTNNCINSAQAAIEERCPPRLFVANAFSPNHDGTNDLFKVHGIHIGSYKLLIFNRWGEVIYESLNKDISWDGIYKGDIMPIGVYPWVITYEGDSQEYLGPYKLEGSVTLVK